MYYLIAYDISHRKRYYRICRLLEGYGYRVQYSIFECEMSRREFRTLWEELETLIDSTEDRLLACPICLSDKPGIVRFGEECILPGWKYRII